jgi:transporter family-2 protein
MAYFLLAFVLGCALPLQALINNQLKSHLGGSTLLTAIVSFIVGIVALVFVSAMTGQRWQSLSAVGKASPWELAGGLLGALYVFGAMLLAPRIGMAKMMSLIIAGQVLVSLVLDHNGWLGAAVREATLTRLAGALLVVLGVLLVNYDRLVRH